MDMIYVDIGFFLPVDPPLETAAALGSIVTLFLVGVITVSTEAILRTFGLITVFSSADPSVDPLRDIGESSYVSGINIDCSFVD